MTPAERIIDHQNSLYWWTNLGLGIALVIGFIVIGCHCGNRTTAIAAYGASLGLGGVLGFLFGVPSAPRSASDPKAKETSVPESGHPLHASHDNSVSREAAQATAVAPRMSTSNLEQVADWVTKLLLGGGLTQMQRIPPKIWQWSHVVAIGIIGDNRDINEALILSQQGFACGLLVYGFVLGFFAGFLITKLQLGKAIAE